MRRHAGFASHDSALYNSCMNNTLPDARREREEGELKFVTLLRSDLVGSTSLVAGLGPEASVLRMDPAIRAMREAVRAYGGTICREVGDGVLAVFGAPVSDEQHAVSATCAALDLVKRVAGLGDPNLRVRVGVHSDVVLAHMIVTDFSSVYDMSGVPLHFVERLQAEAAPGCVCTSEATQSLASGHILFDGIGRRRLRGFSEPVPLFNAKTVLRTSRWRVRAGRSSSVFLGRQGEMDKLTAAAERVRSGVGEAVLLLGESGIGKSRLIHEWIARSTHWTAAVAECSQGTSNGPYDLLKKLVASALDIELSRVETVDLSRNASLTTWSPTDRSALASVLEGQVDPEWHTLTPAARGRAINNSCARLLRERSSVVPMAVLIEDLHWIDEASRSVIEAVLATLDTSRVLVIATARMGYATEWLPATTIRLSALRHAEGLELISAMLRADATPALKEQIFRHTGGVPLFIEEVCRDVGTRKVQNLGLQPEPTLQSLNVPRTVHGVIATRIDRLEGPSKQLLQSASALGRRCNAQLLHSISALDLASFALALTRLQQSGLLVVDESGNGDLLFPHDSLRQVAYESMRESTRVQLHESVLAALEHELLADGIARTSELCWHAQGARQWQKACAYARAVSKACMARSAFADAAAYVDIALNALENLPAGLGREQQAIDLRIESRVVFSGYGRVAKWLDLAKEAGERAFAVSDDYRHLSATAVRAAALNFYGDAREAIAANSLALAKAEALGDAAWLNYVEYALGQAYFTAGHLNAADQMLERSYRRLSDPECRAIPGTTIADMRLLCCMMRCVCNVGRTEIDEAKRYRLEACGVAEERGRPFDRVAAGYCVGVLAIAEGQTEAASRTLKEALKTAREFDVGLFIPIVASQLGISLLAQGDLEEARVALDDAKRYATLVGHRSSEVRACLTLALVLCRLGNSEEAHLLARRQLLAARRFGFEGLEVEAVTCLCAIDSSNRRKLNPSAIRRLRSAIDRAKCIGARSTASSAEVLLKLHTGA